MLKKAKARVLTRQQQSRRQSEVVPARRSKTTQSCPRDQHRLGNSPVVVHWRTSTRRRPDWWRAVLNRDREGAAVLRHVDNVEGETFRWQTRERRWDEMGPGFKSCRRNT